MNKVDFYVCPDCRRIITSTGEVQVSCCGIVIKALEAVNGVGKHILTVHEDGDEVHLSCPHGMDTEHHMVFVAYVTKDTLFLFEQFPNQELKASFKKSKNGMLYYYCNTHGLYQQSL